jgi:hypothetical protein
MPADPDVKTHASPAELYGRKTYPRTAPVRDDAEGPAPKEEADEPELVELPCYSTLRGNRYSFAFDLCPGPDLVVAIPYSDLRPFMMLNRSELRLRFAGGGARITGRNLEPLHVALRDHKVVRIRTAGRTTDAFFPDDQTVVHEIMLESDEDEGRQAKSASGG